MEGEAVRIWVGVLTLVIACNVIALHQWFSPKCCLDMVGCQMASHCLTSGCSTCATQPVATVTPVEDSPANATFACQSVLEGRLVRVSRDIWRPPQGMMVYA